MDVLGLILPDELISSIAMMAFSELPAYVQAPLFLVGVLLATRVAERVIDLIDYLGYSPEKRQEIRNGRRWFKHWRG